MRLDEVSTLVRLRRRTKLDSSSRRIMRLVPVFILEEFNRRRKNVCTSSSKTNYAFHIVRPVFTLDGKHERRIIRLDGLCVSSIKTANAVVVFIVKLDSIP